MCSPKEPKSPNGNQDYCAWITIGGTFIFIVCMALMVFLKVGIPETQETEIDEPANFQVQGAGFYGPLTVALPKRYCKFDTCGKGANCSEGTSRPKCACPPKHVGDPLTECVKLECVDNRECQSHQVCYNQKCVNPCIDACKGRNAKCDVFNQVPVCSCPAGFTGNAAFEDCLEAELDKDYHTEPNMTEERFNTEGPSDQQSQMRDACNPSPCGPNATCSLLQNQALCTYILPPAPFRTTTNTPPAEQHECESDEECDDHFACRDFKCVSPCTDCGENAICKKSDHRATCKCRRGFSGDPNVKCTPECEQDDQCPSSRPSCVEHSCVDPCTGACGINARCRNLGKSTICSCPRFTTGDPLVFCRPSDHSVDFCDPSPCGANATCTLSSQSSDNSTVEEYPVCSCPPGYSGNPRISCDLLECEKASECSDDLDCIQYECVDPCLDGNDSVCGVGAVCASRKHLAICTCLEGKYGDPFTGCYGGGGGGGGGRGGLSAAVIASLIG